MEAAGSTLPDWSHGEVRAPSFIGSAGGDYELSVNLSFPLWLTKFNGSNHKAHEGPQRKEVVYEELYEENWWRDYLGMP